MLSQFSGAVVDDSRKHRFILWRFWNEKPRILFIGLNPSTADEYYDDPTVHRLLNFANLWGYGGLYLCNAFSYRATNPKDLFWPNCLHPANTPAIQMACALTVVSVLMWGDGIEKVENGKSVGEHIKKTVKSVWCFGKTKKGNPLHPLYLPSNAELIEYE